MVTVVNIIVVVLGVVFATVVSQSTTDDHDDEFLPTKEKLQIAKLERMITLILDRLRSQEEVQRGSLVELAELKRKVDVMRDRAHCLDACRSGNSPQTRLCRNFAEQFNFLLARRSKRCPCYGNVSGWLAGWVGVRHTPVLYQNG